MSVTTTARDRAEELLQNVQKRARELLDAEAGLVKTVRALVEEKWLTPAELKKRLEDFVGRVGANEVWDRLQKADAFATFEGYKSELEKRVDLSLQGLFDGLRLAKRDEVDALAAQVASLKAQVEALTATAKN